jgi:hypothetical protein
MKKKNVNKKINEENEQDLRDKYSIVTLSKRRMK